MTTFEEEFPDINKWAELAAGEGAHSLWYITGENLQAHCLDKQRVREAIERGRTNVIKKGCRDNDDVCIILYGVLKELGL